MGSCELLLRMVCCNFSSEPWQCPIRLGPNENGKIDSFLDNRKNDWLSPVRWQWGLPAVYTTFLEVDTTPNPTFIKNRKANMSMGCCFINGYSLSIAQHSKEQAYPTIRMKIIKNNIKVIHS